MNPPFKLLYRDKQIGVITSYSYETPWASGSLESVDQRLVSMLSNAREYLNYIDKVADLDLPEPEDDRLCEKRFMELSLEHEYVDMLLGDNWSIEKQGGEVCKIYSPIFYTKGFVDWRV